MNQRMTKETASETRAFAYNLSGNMIREQTTYWSEYVYLGGHRLAMVINGTPPGSGCSFIKGGNWKNVALNTLLIFSPAFLFAVIIYRRKNTLKAVIIICGMSGAIILVSYLTTPALEEGTEIKWFLNDHLDTPMWMVNADKSMYNRRYLDAYGNPSNEFHPQLNNFFFPGQYRDTEGYLYYNWNRYYMPWVGRYNRTDPLKDKGDNLYSYGYSNPIIYFDISGLKCSKLDVFSCLSKYSAMYEYWNLRRPGWTKFWGLEWNIAVGGLINPITENTLNYTIPINCDYWSNSLISYLNKVGNCAGCCTVSRVEAPYKILGAKRAHSRVKIKCEDDECNTYERLWDPWLRPANPMLGLPVAPLNLIINTSGI